jgi:hypothetical protein
MDWSPFLVGGATRPDAITGLQPQFRDAVGQMLQDAQRQGVNLRITSAYRSPEVQARLWENALAKYGSAEAARKWVAPPGKSQHNMGTAVDFAGPGGLLRDANSPEAQWLRANAGRFGLDIPMDWEPWQVELAGARGGQMASYGGPNEPANALASQGGMDPMQQFNALASAMPRYEAPQLDANAFRIGRV